MSRGPLTGVFVLTALGLMLLAAGAHDQTRYPNWEGQWLRIGPANFDPSKPGGLRQQAPLNPEYQAKLEASLAAQAAGGQGNDPMGHCIPPGMPRMMIGYGGIEIIINEGSVLMVFADPMRQYRRIHTDGRAWPPGNVASYSGTSIGTWEDTNGDGRYDTLTVETRGGKFPRTYESSGIPLHDDGQAIIKERIYLDPAKPDILYDDMTVIDHALTRPWTVKRTYGRQSEPVWFEAICGEDDHQVRIGAEDYYLSGDGHLMPTRANQPPPDLRRFNPSPK